MFQGKMFTIHRILQRIIFLQKCQLFCSRSRKLKVSHQFHGTGTSPSNTISTCDSSNYHRLSLGWSQCMFHDCSHGERVPASRNFDHIIALQGDISSRQSSQFCGLAEQLLSIPPAVAVRVYTCM